MKIITAEQAVARNEDPASIHRVADWHGEMASYYTGRAANERDGLRYETMLNSAERHTGMANRLRYAAVSARRMMNQNAAHASLTPSRER